VQIWTITNLKSQDMMLRILLFFLLPLLGMAQTNSKVEMPMVGNTTSEKQALEIKRNVQYNLEEIKVRWKKAALENCTGVPCVVTPPAPSFTCGTSTMTDKDNNTYSTVSIGAQCWTTTNLKVTRYDDGSLIPDLTSSISNPWATSGARTEYVAAGVTGYVGTFGYLYNWYAVNDPRKLCPAGWHVPTDAEWTIMINTLDPSQAVTSVNVSTFTGPQSSTAGTVMKSTVTNATSGSGLGWDPATSTPPGTNTSGFTGLPGGYRADDGSFYSIRSYAFFWSATEYAINVSRAWLRNLYSFISFVNRERDFKSVGASVRCLRD
jgi:uncharacterized protein (TIGR02145 family)